MERWALKRYIRRVSRQSYIQTLDRFIQQYEEAFGCKAEVELKLYRAPRIIQTWLSDDMPEDNASYRLPATKLLTAELWREARVVECIIRPAAGTAPFEAMFASVEAKGSYPRQITFYVQGIGADAACQRLKSQSQKGSGFAIGSFNDGYRCHHR